VAEYDNYSEVRLSDRNVAVDCFKFYSGMFNRRWNVDDLEKKIERQVNSEITGKRDDYENWDAVTFWSSLWLLSP
jgi:hypothetical protein